jgi:tRNA(Ile)-lysidine synthase TilS/MesJ
VPYDDPHNADAGYTRVRARALLPVLERELGPGVVSGLARSAELARDDADALDALAQAAFDDLGRELPVPGWCGWCLRCAGGCCGWPSRRRAVQR